MSAHIPPPHSAAAYASASASSPAAPSAAASSHHVHSAARYLQAHPTRAMRRQQVRILLLGSDCELLQRIFHQHRRLYCRSNDAGSVHSVDVVLLTLADLLSDILGITVAECSQLLADPEQKLQLHHLNEHPRMQQLSLVWICSRENAFQTSWRMYEAVLQMFGPPHGVVTSDAPNVVGRLPFVIVETNPQPPAATTPSATSSALVDFAHAKRAAGCTQLSSIHEGVESPNPQLRLLTQQRCVYIAQIAEEARRLQVGEADASEEEEKKGGEQPVSVPASSAAPAPCIFSELDDFQLRHVCVGLTAASAASSLTIFSSWMTDRGVSTLAATLQTLSRSQHLHLHTINLTRALSCAITTYNRLIQSLVGLPLKSLVIAGNNIDPSSDDASARAELGRTHQHLLEATPSLVHLHLTTLPASVDAVRSIVQIQHLDLSGAVSGITDDAARSAFHASLLSLWRDPTSPIRAKGSRLQHLSLANNQLTGDAISDLLNHLADHPHLTALDLSKNHLTNSAEMVEGLTVLLHSLTSRLRALDLSSNLLAEFSPVLYEKPLRLQQLLLRGNPITNLPQYLLNSTTSAQLLHHLALMGRAAVSSSSSSIAPPPPRRLRLLLLGNGCAGKTFLKDRLLLLPRDHPPSDISEWTVDQAVDWIREKGYEEEVVYHLRKKSFNGRNLDERDVDSLEENIRVLLAGDEDLQQAVERLIADVKALQEQADQNMASGATLYTSTVGILTDSFTHSFYDASSGRRIEVIVDVLDFAGQQEYFMSHSLFMTDVQAVYVLVNNLTKKETAKEASSAASLRHVVNAEYESQIHFWLSFLQSLFPSSAAVDVTVVQTHLDQLHRISDTKKQPNPTKLRESLRTRHGSVFGQLEVLQLDYSEQDASAATSSASVRASLLQRIESKAVRIASPYDGVEHTLAQWITTVRASGKLPVVTTKDVMVRLRDVVRSLSHPAASLDATLEAAMAHLTVAGLLLPIAAMGVVILEPLQWFAHCIAAFVSGNSGDEAHRGSSPGGIRSENGIIEWHSIVPHAAQLLCTGEKKEEQLKLLMSLLVHFGLCYPLHQGKELPRYLFPCLLPAHPHQHEEIRRFMRCDEVEVDYNQQIQLNHFARQQHIEAKYLQPSAAASSASASSSSSASAFDYPRFVERGPSRFIFSVVGRDWSCKSSAQGDVAVDFPPTLFPQLQMACLRHFGATCTQYGQGFICIQTRFERGFIHLIPSQRCIRTVVGGHAPQVLLGEMVEVVETSLLPVASLEQSMQRYSLCRFCLGMLCFPQRQTGASPPELLEQVSGVQDEAGCTYKQFCVSVDRFDLASEASHRCSVSGLPQHTAASPRSASEAEATIDPIRSAFYREDTQSLFLLSQSYVTELSVEAAANFSVQAGPQELFSNGARSIPAHYDASLALDDGTVVFFRGSSYWRSSTDFSHLLDEDVPCAFLEPSAYYPRPMSDTVTSTAWRDDIHPCLVKAAASGKDGGTTDEIQSLQASSDLDTRLFALPSSVFVEALNTSQVDGQSSSVVFGTIDLTRCSSALVNLWKSHATLSHLIDFSRSPSDVEVAAKVLRKSHASMTRQQLLQDCIDEIETNLRLFAHPHAHLLPMLGYSIELAREGRAEAEANTIEDLVALAHLLDEEQMDEVRVTLIFPRLPQSLESLVTSHPLPLSSANNLDAITSILAQAAEAVHHCHELGLVHRDLSSRSFLFDPARRVFLSDFRQARFLAKRNRSLGASEQSGASSSFGQASFSDAIKTARSAPESFTHRVYSRQTDVFQFGRFMAEILAVWPREFVATRATHAENMEADSVVHGISANVQVESHRWPRALCDLVTACCYSHPDHRPTIKEVHQQLRSFPISLSHSAASSSSTPSMLTSSALSTPPLPLGDIPSHLVAYDRFAPGGELAPAEVRSMWPKDMPADVETACQHPISKQIYLISGALYWKLERAAAGGACEWGMCAGYPKHIPLEWNWPIMQTPKADAALPPFSAWQYERLVVFATPAALWLLKGGLVWKILAASSAAQEDDLRLDPSPTYPLLMSQWKGWDEWSEKKIDVTVLATRSSPASSEQVDPRSYSSVSGPSVASAAPGVTVPVVATADCYALGHSFLFGRAHLPRDVERAVQIFRALARSRDHAASWCVLGCVQQLERGEAAAFAFTDDASQCFLRAAELGSLLGLSLVHEKGSGSFAKDARIARNFAHLAVLSDPSDAYACARLAGLLQQGSPAEMKDALALYERALSLGVDSVIEPMSLLLVSVQPPDMNRAMHMLTTMITDAGRRTAAIAALMQLLDEIRSQQASVEAQGQWTCVRCTLRNDPSSYACAACDADRPAEDNASSSSVADESKNDPSHRETSMVLTREILDKLRCADGIIDATGAEEVSQWKFDLKLDLSTLPPPSPLVPSSLNLFSSAAEFEQLYQRAFIVKSLPYYAYHRPSSLPLPSYSWSLPYDLRSFSQRERDCREEVEENAMKDEIRKLQELIPSNLRVHSHDLTPECLLGSGLSSEVWLSMFTGQKHLGSKFAVKAFQSSGAVSLPRRQLFDHFKHELEVYLSLDRERHPHLLQFYGVVLEEEAHDAGWIGAPRLEMKLLLQHMPRNSLATVLAEEKSNLKIDWSKPDRTNLRRLVGVLRECASALAFLHTRGLIHCDVAARNFLLDSHHTVRICDFGLARFLPRNPSFFARAPSKRGVEECGKMGFRRGGEEEVLPRLAMAPESLRENVKGTPYSRSTDIWSFGILTWQALSGRTAWNQQDWNAKQWPQLAGANGERCLVMAIAAGQLQLEPESHWPKSLQDLVAKCLHENPIMRETHAIFPKETRETKSGMHLIIEELTQIEKELSAA